MCSCLLDYRMWNIFVAISEVFGPRKANMAAMPGSRGVAQVDGAASADQVCTVELYMICNLLVSAVTQKVQVC